MKQNLTIILVLLAISFCLSSCNCSNVDCGYEAMFNFKLVDKDSKQDLIYDVNIPLANFVLTSEKTGETISIDKYETTKSLSIFFNPPDTDFKLDYQGQIILFTLQINSFKDECCNEYRVTSISTLSGVDYGNGDKLFIIEI